MSKWHPPLLPVLMARLLTPDFLFEGDYPVINGNIVVPVNDMLGSFAYNLIVTTGPTSNNPKYRYEAESPCFSRPTRSALQMTDDK